MAGRYFEDFEVGEKIFGKGITITETHVVQFAGITGDFHPLHTNEDHAKKTQWGKRIVHGLLTACMAIPELGNIVSDTAVAHTKDIFNYTAPVFFGDTIQPEFEITGLEQKKHWGKVSIKLVVKNQKGDVVVDGSSEVLVNKRPE